MIVFAHRGESAIHPENSQVAIRHCNDQMMDGIEVDVFETENDFVIFHDRWLTRLLNIDKHVTQLTDYDLATIKGNDGEPLPTLAWLIEYCAQFNFTLNIEIKYLKSIHKFEKELSRLCTQHNFDRSRLLISSFNHHYLENIATHLPDLKLGLLLAVNPINIELLLKDFPLYSVHLDMDCLNEALIHKIQSFDLKVFVFTVDHTEEIEWLFNVGANGIFANHPRQAFNIIEQLKPTPTS